MHIAPDFMIRGTCIAQHAIKLTPARVRIYMRAHPENRYIIVTYIL